MERRGIGIEVLGVPNILPNDRIVDKLTIHFLRPRHGGGEVQRVLYPSYRPGQALVIFEDPEVAGRVLQQSCHVLEIDKQRFTLQVKAADKPEVDLPVEANLDLSVFPDEEEVRQLLTSYGFQTADSHSGQVRVKGTFMMLTAAKAHMEKLLNSQTQDHSSSSSPIVNGSRGYSSGAVPKCHNDNGSSVHAGNRSPVVGDRPSYALPSSPITTSSGSGSLYIQPSSPEYEGGRSLRRDHQPSPRPDSESIVIDADVLDYAQRFNKKDIADILVNHNATMNVSHGGGDMSNVILSGKSVKIVRGKLQSLLNDLTKTLRTQEIPLADLDHKVQVNVARQIKVYKGIYPKVLVSQVGDTVRLVGPSTDIYEFKQRVLGKPVDQTPGVRPGRTLDRSLRLRSSSVPKTPTKRSTDGDDATSKLQPATTQHYSPTRYQDERGRGAGVEPGAGAAVKSSAALRRRSNSATGERALEQKAALRQEKESTKPATGQTSPLDKLKKTLKPLANSLKPKKRK